MHVVDGLIAVVVFVVVALFIGMGVADPEAREMMTEDRAARSLVGFLLLSGYLALRVLFSALGLS